MKREYRRRVAAALPAGLIDATEGGSRNVTETDLASLPTAVATYLRRAGSVGEPRITGFRARLHGRIRATATSAWMPFTGEQVNTYGRDSCRIFSMDASLHGVPIDVLHVFVGDRATMRVRAASLVPLVNAAGPEMDQAETVTLFNDLCVFAPAALVDAEVTWAVLAPDRVHATFTRGSQRVGADLLFDSSGDLVDFISDDRLAGSRDGRSFTPRRWSTPLSHYQSSGRRRLATCGEARWGTPDLDEPFTYLELTIDDVQYATGAPTTEGPVGQCAK